MEESANGRADDELDEFADEPEQPAVSPVDEADPNILWRTLPLSVGADRRTELTKRLDPLIQVWVSGYNFGIDIVYWIAYAVCMLPSLLLFSGCLATAPFCGWFAFTARTPNIIGAAVALAVLTVLYEKLSTSTNVLTTRIDVTFSVAIAIAMIVCALIAHFTISAGNVLTCCRVAGSVGWIWLLFLILEAMVFPLFHKIWLNRFAAAHPVAAITYALKEVVRITRGSTERGLGMSVATRSTAVADLEIAIIALIRGINGSITTQSPSLKKWLLGECNQIVAAIREIQQAVIFPDLQDLPSLETKAAIALKTAVEGDWANFPRGGEDTVIADSSERSWIDSARLIAIAMLPGAGVLVVFWLNQSSKLISPGVLFWSEILAIAWFVFNLLRTLTPDLDSRISSFSAAIGTLSPLSRQDLKK